MKNRSAWVVFLALAIAGSAIFVHRERMFAEQKRNGFNASGESLAGNSPFTTVLSVGDVFLSFDSANSSSTLWMARSRETLSSWLFPPTIRPMEFARLIQWKAPGRVAWFLTGNASVDLLIELTPESNHRLAVVRANCSGGACRTTTQERALPDAKLVVSADERAALLDDKKFVVYNSIADLMRDTGATTPRYTNPQSGELLARSADTTLLISNPPALSGEIIDDSGHSRLDLKIDNHGTAAGVALNDGLQLVIDDDGRTRLWDCRGAKLNEGSECTVYTAPDEFPHLGFVSITDDECGIAMHRNDWTWLVRRNARTEEVLPATGIVKCGSGELLTYRTDHVDNRLLQHRPVTSELKTLHIERH